jgi:hypothetical protein
VKHFFHIFALFPRPSIWYFPLKKYRPERVPIFCWLLCWYPPGLICSGPFLVSCTVDSYVLVKYSHLGEKTCLLTGGPKVVSISRYCSSFIRWIYTVYISHFLRAPSGFAKNICCHMSPNYWLFCEELRMVYYKYRYQFVKSRH